MVVTSNVKRAVSRHDARANVDALGRAEHRGVEESSPVVTSAVDEDFTKMANEVDLSVDSGWGGFDLSLSVDAACPDNFSCCGVQAGDELVTTVQHVKVAIVEQR